MMRSQSKPQIDTQFDDGYIAFKEDSDISVFVHIPGISGKEEGDLLVITLANSIVSTPFTTATEFDSVVSGAWHKLNFPLTFSIACVYRKEDEVLLKTYGNASIRLSRGKEDMELVSQGAFAEGLLHDGDTLTLYVEKTGHSNVKISFGEQQEAVVEQTPVHKPTGSPSTRYNLRKTGLTAILCLIAFFLLWSGSNTFMSKTAQADNKNIQFTKELITQKLDQARDVLNLNAGRATALIIEAKTDLKNLKKKLNGRRDSEVKTLAQLISDSEKNILQKNQRGSKEFFDLGLEEKGARGVDAWNYEDKVVITNPKGAVYIVSLEKKSLESRVFSQLSDISLAGLDDGVVYAFKNGTGVLKIESEGSKPAVVIKQDKEWGSITDLLVFNKNLYLLDSKKGQIYKYIPTEDGFATRSAYFKSGAYAQGATSFAIDQSVYVSQPHLVTKYTAGLQDGFTFQYPDREPTVTRVITNADLDDIYLWDKSHASIVILSKTGSYQSEVESPVFSKATSVMVYKDSAYALQGSKLYQVPLK